MNPRFTCEYTVLDLHICCVTGLSNGLAIRATLTRVSLGGWKGLLHGSRRASGFILVPYYVFVVLRFKWCLVYFNIPTFDVGRQNFVSSMSYVFRLFTFVIFIVRVAFPFSLGGWLALPWQIYVWFISQSVGIQPRIFLIIGL